MFIYNIVIVNNIFKLYVTTITEMFHVKHFTKMKGMIKNEI